MAQTLRLSPEADAALIRVAALRHVSKNAAANAAILEADARTSQVDRARAFAEMIQVRDAELLDRLAQ